MLLLPEGHTGETWELTEEHGFSEIGEHWIEKYFQFFLTVGHAPVFLWL
jgi:hypothetical protein